MLRKHEKANDKDFYDPRADQDFWKNGTNFHNASDN